MASMMATAAAAQQLAQLLHCASSYSAQCIDLVFKLSYGNMLYMGESGHFTLKWPSTGK